MSNTRGRREQCTVGALRSLMTGTVVPGLLGLLATPLAGQAVARGPAAVSVDSARPTPVAVPGTRTLMGARVVGNPPRIDGRLDDPAWSMAPVATGFVQQEPQPGAPATQRTEARVLFDDQALYVGVRAFDGQPEWIVAPYPRRDDETTSDWIFVEIDSRHDRRTARSFGINPRGVQVDGVFYDDVHFDYSWDGVWEGVATVDSLGWCAEFRIPFSQLPYARTQGRAGADSTLTWGFNVGRQTARLGESADWSPRLPTNAGVVSYFNELVGIVAPSTPSRLEVIPYGAVTATRAPSVAGAPPGRDRAPEPSAGADVRLRLTPSLTLSAALHPDFGQVEADPAEINLTTFETFLPERRPLFVADASLFRFDAGLPFLTRGDDFSAAQPFYSRRIGRPPEVHLGAAGTQVDAPGATPILGAAKLSGRTAGGWSVGVLGALADAVDGRLLASPGEQQYLRLEPRTAFGVARISKDFRRGASAIGGMATMVARSAGTALDSTLPGTAVVVAVDGRHRLVGASGYEVSGFALASRVQGTAAAITALRRSPPHLFQRPDARHLEDDTTATSLGGFAAQARIAKLGGSWHGSLAGHVISPGFEPNDAGFQRNADWLIAMATVEYEAFPSHGPVRHWSLGSDQLGIGWSFGGERRAAVANINGSVDLRSFWTLFLSVDHEFPDLATDVLRGGPALLVPARDAVWLDLSSDARRRFQVGIESAAWREPGSGSQEVRLAPSVSWRAADRLALSASPAYTRTVNGWQYVDQLAALGSEHYLLARLDQTTTSLTLRADYAFTPRFTVQLYAQPFLSAGRYDRFAEVGSPRAARPADRVVALAPGQISLAAGADAYRIDFDGDGVSDTSLEVPDFSRMDLNANLVLRWEYHPGATLFLVWSQERHAGLADGTFRLGRRADRLFATMPTNVLLLKASYWLSL